MAKKSMIERQRRREKSVKQHAAKRAKLLEVLRSQIATDEQKDAARLRLQALPRDASPVRLRNRCSVSGRSQGFYRKFGLGRNMLREAAMRGEIPGLSKASW
jgi:small subunit ribosomal protein S14